MSVQGVMQNKTCFSYNHPILHLIFIIVVNAEKSTLRGIHLIDL